MVHSISISTREIIVRSSRDLSGPGTLFKNLMATLRDVVICYDGTVRNVCSNSTIQSEYGVKTRTNSERSFPAGEPVGVLAATRFHRIMGAPLCSGSHQIRRPFVSSLVHHICCRAPPRRPAPASSNAFASIPNPSTHVHESHANMTTSSIPISC